MNSLKLALIASTCIALTACVGSGGDSNAVVDGPTKFTYCVLGSGPSAEVMINTILVNDTDKTHKILKLSKERDTLKYNYLTYNYKSLYDQLGITKDSSIDQGLADVSKMHQGGSLTLISYKPYCIGENGYEYRTNSIYEFDKILESNESIAIQDSRLTVEALQDYLTGPQVVDMLIKKNNVYKCDNLIVAAGSHGVTKSSSDTSLAEQIGVALWGKGQQKIKYEDDIETYNPPLQQQELEGLANINISYSQLISSNEMEVIKNLGNERDKEILKKCVCTACECVKCYFDGGGFKPLEYITIAKADGDKYAVNYLGVSNGENHDKNYAIKRFIQLTGITYSPNIPEYPAPVFFNVTSKKLTEQHYELKKNNINVVYHDEDLWFAGDSYKTPIYFRSEGVRNMLADAELVSRSILKKNPVVE